MAPIWSRIHASLGESPRSLTFDLLQAAVDQGVVEDEDLDWKSTLPGKEEERLEEFAKDVSAMANTRGGLLVYGIEEERGKGSAKDFRSVDNSEGAQRRLRALANSRIHPRVIGLSFTPLESADGKHTVLVLSIPRSPDAPHIIGQGEKLGIAYRDGAETRWMRERDLERAYSDRRARRVSEEARLVEFVSDTSEQLNLDRHPWIVGVATPRSPNPSVAGPITAGEVLTILEQVLSRTQEISSFDSQHRITIIRDIDSGARNPRVGLRRWIAQPNEVIDPDKQSDSVLVELHHDGSVVLAAALRHWVGAEHIEDKYPVPVGLVENFAADFVALSETYARHFGDQAPMAMRIDLVRGDLTKPFAAIAQERYGNSFVGAPMQPSWSRTVRRFRPVVGEVPSVANAEALRDIARQLAQDVLHQFGIPDLLFLRG